MNAITTQLPFRGVMTSMIGGRKENQDTCGFSDTARGLLLVVCDGMGGGPGGKTASSIATTTIIGYVQQAPSDVDSDEAKDDVTLLKDAIVAANKALRDKIAEVPDLEGMGTTVTAVLLTTKGAAVAHVGDSRIYQIRQRKMIFRTADHSRVGEMVRGGALTEEQARLSAISNIITRALGVKDEIEVDAEFLPFQRGDRFILCCDGIWGAMPEPELIKLFCSNRSLEITASNINAKVESAGQSKGGGHDNYTMIIVEADGKHAVNPNAFSPVSKSPINIPTIGSRTLAFVITAIIVVIFAIFFLKTKFGSDKNNAPNPIIVVDSTDAKSDSIIAVSEVVSEIKADVAAPVNPEQAKSDSVLQIDSNTSQSVAAANESRDDTIAQIAALVQDRDKLIAKIESMNSVLELLSTLDKRTDELIGKFGKNGLIKSAKKDFINIKGKAIDCIKSIEAIDIDYTPEEKDLLFKESRKGPNGIKGALGGRNSSEIPDSAGCEIIKRRIEDARNSITKRKEELQAQLNQINN